MRFNSHSHLEGAHAFLSPSSYHWINYDPDKLVNRFRTSRAAIEGVEMHRYAAEAIELREFQVDDESTLGLYINDCISLGMIPEVLLYYSDNCFGTADAIRYEDLELDISDLKTGVSRASVHQLEIYAAIFCLEYGINPNDLRRITLRIYQSGECRAYIGTPSALHHIINQILVFDGHLNILRLEEEG